MLGNAQIKKKNNFRWKGRWLFTEIKKMKYFDENL